MIPSKDHSLISLIYICVNGSTPHIYKLATSIEGYFRVSRMVERGISVIFLHNFYGNGHFLFFDEEKMTDSEIIVA